MQKDDIHAFRWWKIPAVLLLLTLMGLSVFSISPIYRFAPPQPFAGPDIYNPYAALDSTLGWKRANFHTHTRVDGPLNECPEYPAVVYDDYVKMGYDILAFSNHMALTRHPYDSTLSIAVYEHGYNLFKFHKLVFGATRVLGFDHLLPLLPSQKQWQYDLLGRDADFLVMNHPDRTLHTTKRSMELLTGYRLIEADCGVDSGLRHWDEALGAGHYVGILINDDCHDSRSHERIARRCNFLNTPSGRYADIRRTLLSGCYYAMRVPDFGGGNLAVKRRANRRLPFVRAVGLEDGEVFLRLSRPAERIEVTGAERRLLLEGRDTAAIRYRIRPEDPYVRITAFFREGTILYTNAFARYDAAVSDTPYKLDPHPVRIGATIGFNLLLLLIFCGCGWLLWRLAHPVVRIDRRR